VSVIRTELGTVRHRQAYNLPKLLKSNEEKMNIAEHKIGNNIVLEILESRLGADKAAAFEEGSVCI